VGDRWPKADTGGLQRESLELLNAKPREIKSFMRVQLPPTQPRFTERRRGVSCTLPIRPAPSEQTTVRIPERHGNTSTPLSLPTLQPPDRQTKPLAGSMLLLCEGDPLGPPSVPSSRECAVDPSRQRTDSVSFLAEEGGMYAKYRAKFHARYRAD
jgi:hypothetical protein